MKIIVFFVCVVAAELDFNSRFKNTDKRKLQATCRAFQNVDVLTALLKRAIICSPRGYESYQKHDWKA